MGLYVDDFAFFSYSNAVEEKFRTLLNAEYTVSYDDSLEWFLGMKFDWKETPDALKYHVHQEAFILDIVDRYGLTDCNKSTRATPFMSGFPVDNIRPLVLPEDQQNQLTKQYQQLIDDLSWLSISTRPDITAIVSLLSAHSHRPSPAHIESACHVVKYLASTASFGLYYTSDKNENFHAFVHFPTDETNALQAYCGANWGPMDASVPKPDAVPLEQSIESLRSLSRWFIMNAGAPIAWGCARHKDTAQSSCQAEVHSINQTTKLILEYKLLFRDIDLPAQQPTRCTRHMDIKHFASTDWVERDLLIMKRINTSDNSSDAMTKAQGRQLHYRHTDYVLGKIIPAYVAAYTKHTHTTIPNTV